MFQPAAIFGDSMILCRNKELRVFGESDDGMQVAVKLTAPNGSVMAASTAKAVDGRFLVLLPPQSASENCTLTISCDDAVYTYTDVAIGDVYLAGGQSNMELELQNEQGGEAAIAVHNDPLLRYYNVPKVPLHTTETLQNERYTRWQKIVPGNGRDISAVAYYFAKKIRALTGVPVGIVDCYWGGTSITCWLSKETLMASVEGQRYWNTYFDPVADQTEEEYIEKEQAYQARVDAWCAVERRLCEEAGLKVFAPEVEKEAGPFPWPPPDGVGSFLRPGGLYETMVKRIIPYAMTGVIFYQGESDCGRTQLYDCFMVDLVRSWRNVFRDETLPFMFTQLCMYQGDGPDDGNWAAMRLMQEKACKLLQNTDLVIQIDQGEQFNIHPVNKVPVAERLYELARALVYGLEGKTSPKATGKYTENGVLTVTLSAPVQGEAVLFEVAGQDGKYVPAEATLDGACIHLSSNAVDTPIHARYAYCNWGVVYLAGENSLPLAPFSL